MIRQTFSSSVATASGASNLLILIAILLCQGCGGDDWQASTHPAAGNLTVNGEPAVGAVVELHSVGRQPDIRNSRPWAIVQDDGSFTLSTYESGDGAPLGDYAVTIRWPPDVTQPSMADLLGGAFATAQKTKWNVTITEGQNHLPAIAIDDVELQGKASGSVPRTSPPMPHLGNETATR